MCRFAGLILLVPLAAVAAENRVGNLDDCSKGRAQVAAEASDFQGADRIKRLIEADLTRAGKEENEGDADECIEALEHASKLLAGQY